MVLTPMTFLAGGGGDGECQIINDLECQYKNVGKGGGKEEKLETSKCSFNFNWPELRTLLHLVWAPFVSGCAQFLL